MSEVTSFNKLAILYFYAIGNLKAAESRYEILNELAPEDPDTEEIFPYLMKARLEAGRKRMEEENKTRISVKTISNNKTLQRETKPDFINREIDWLYENGLRIEKEKLRIILSLPYNSLVSDLTLILKDIPETFRQEEDFIEFWYGDFLTNGFWEPLYYLSENNLGTLKEFVLTPNIWIYARSEISCCVGQIGLHQPERKGEVIKWFRDIFNHLAEASLEDEIIDSDFIGLAICDAQDLRAT